MKNRKKMVVCGLTVVCISAFAMVGCGSNESSHADSQVQQTQEDSSVESSDAADSGDDSLNFSSNEEEQEYINKLKEKEEIIYEDTQEQEVDESSPSQTYRVED